MEFQAKPADGQDDVKVKQIALRTNENIQTMIKDLFHSPPIYKASVTLSFKVASNASFQDCYRLYQHSKL